MQRIHTILLFLCINVLAQGMSLQSILMAQSTSRGNVSALTYFQEKEILRSANPSISIELWNVSLEEALLQIAEKAKAGIYFDADLLPDRRVNLNFQETPLSDVLRKVLTGTQLEIYTSNRNIFLKRKEIPGNLNHINFQGRQIVQESVSGRVTDAESGDPLPGVNIAIKGTNTGTTTNMDGLYDLTVPSLQDTLIFSFIGYKTEEIPLNGRSQVDVSLQPQAITGEALVVTALNILKTEKSIGYSTQRVRPQELVVAQEPNVINNLNGKVAGLTIFNSPDFFGNSTIQLRGENPLIVIDGIPNEDANLWAIDATNIESIDVLKGTTASALYGSLGRNGAIMINTKRGSRTDEESFQVEFNSSTTFQPNFLRVPEKQNEYGSGRNGEYKYVDGTGFGIEGFGFTWGPPLDQPDPNTESGFVEIAQFNSPIDPETGERIPIPWISRGENNMDNFFRTGMTTNNSLSVTAGNENRNIRASISNKYQRGITPNTSLQSNFLNLAGTYRNDDFMIDASFNYNQQTSDNVPEVVWSSQSIIYNLAMWMGSNIDVRDLQDYWIEGQEGFQQRHYSRAFYNNPYFLANEYNRGFFKDVVNSQISLSYNIDENLTILSRSGFNFFSQEQPEEEPISFVRNFTRQRGNFRTRHQNNFNFTSDLVLEYSRDINEDFSFSSTVGGSTYYYESKSAFLSTDGLVVPNFYNMANSQNALQGSNFLTEYKKNSVYGIVNLSYQEMLYLELTGRNDWVSTLPLENNSFFYPSVSTSFVLSEAINLPAFINTARVRASWAQVSNADFGSNYAHIPTYRPGISWQNNNSLQFPGSLISPDLEPETSTSYETGLDFTFVDGRISIDFTYFLSKETNNIVNVPISVTSGFSSRLENANTFEKRGFEVILRGVPVQSRQFVWDFMVNVGRSVTYIDKIDIGDNIGKRVEGDRIDDIFTTVWLKAPDGQYILDSSGNNIRDPFERRIGYAGPDLTFGMQNTFDYRNVSLNVGIDGRLGGLMNSPTLREMYWNGIHPDLVGEDRLNSTKGISSYIAPGVVVVSGDVEYDNDGNIISDTREFAPNNTPVNFENYMVSFHSRNYGNHWYSESFVKLREVSLSYRLPQRLTPLDWFREVSFSITGRNLFIISDIEYLDPDSGSGIPQTPSMRSYGFNLNIKF